MPTRISARESRSKSGWGAGTSERSIGDDLVDEARSGSIDDPLEDFGTRSDPAPFPTGNADERKSAFVIGANRGLGRLIAICLAKAGMAVGFVARTSAQVSETQEGVRRIGGRCMGFSCDFVDAGTLNQLVEKTERSLGPIDFLAINSFCCGVAGPTWETDTEDWWGNVTVNLLAVYVGLREVLPRMVSRDAGRIVTIVDGGSRKEFPFLTACGTAGAAAENLVKSTSTELEKMDSSVKLFMVNPGSKEKEIGEALAAAPDDGGKWRGEALQALQKVENPSQEEVLNLLLKIQSGRLDSRHGELIGRNMLESE